MIESTYEATRLLEADLAQFSPSPAARGEAVTSAIAAAAGPSTRDVQAALAAEFMSLSGAHDELIRHYMPLNDAKASLA